jgi:hypothetical protein
MTYSLPHRLSEKNTNIEIRNPKQARNLKFKFRASNLFRDSIFGFRVFLRLPFHSFSIIKL